MGVTEYDMAFVAAVADASGTLEAIGEDPALSAGAVQRYARAVADAALLRARWRKRGLPTTTAGSTGQTVVHPMVEGVRKAEREAADLGDRLGLTPAARRAMARSAGRGVHRSPDRRGGGIVRLVTPGGGDPA